MIAPLREVLYGYAQRESKGSAGGYPPGAGDEAGVHDSYRHTFRDVVKRDRQDHHGYPRKPACGPFGLVDAAVQVGDGIVQQKKEEDAKPEAGKGGEESEASQTCRLFYGRHDQAPDRSCDHNSRSEAGERPLDAPS